MGGNTKSTVEQTEYASTMADFEVIQEITTENLIFLEHKRTHVEYLLRQLSYNDKRQFQKAIQTTKLKKQQLAGCNHVTPLVKYMTKSEDQFCSTFHKIYVLYEYPQRTLDDEISERNLQKKKFQEKELWSILACCILGLSHLQKHCIKHLTLKSSVILISHEGIIKVTDPFTTGCSSNYDTMLNKRSTTHIYLSPEQTDALQQEIINPHYHPYKSDIWALGMILLEAGLLQYQDECYRDECSRIHWETLQYNINRFGQTYSNELTNMVEFMLSKDQRSRPQWVELEQLVMKVDENVRASSVAVNKSEERLSRVGTHPPPEPRVSAAFGSLNQEKTPPQVGKGNMDSIFNATKRIDSPMLMYPSERKPIVTTNQKPVVGSSHKPMSVSVPLSHEMQPVPVSNINITRPLKSVFPNPNYQTLTKVDENLIVVDDSETGTEMEMAINSNSSSYQNLHANGVKSMKEKEREGLIGVAYPLAYPAQQVPLRDQMQRSPTFESPPQGQFVIETFKLGSRYEGYKSKGMRHGQGKFYYQDGGLYDGEWRNNNMEGYGKLYYQSGKIAYDGCWMKDQFTGRGVLYNDQPEPLKGAFNYANLDNIEEFWTRYEGEFKEDVKHGKGIIYLSNGEFFEGLFHNDAAEGPGVFQTLNNRKVVGKWHNNQFIG